MPSMMLILMSCMFLYVYGTVNQDWSCKWINEEKKNCSSQADKNETANFTCGFNSVKTDIEININGNVCGMEKNHCILYTRMISECCKEQGKNDDRTWSSWTNCSRATPYTKCLRTRYKEIYLNNATTENIQCKSREYQSKPCCEEKCKVDGGFTTWSNWTTCSNSSCGNGGPRERNRSCTNPMPQYGGENCTGNITEYESCWGKYCPQQLMNISNIQNWSSWTNCSRVTPYTNCTRTRDRKLYSHDTNISTRQCNSWEHQLKPCQEEDCKVDGNFTTWSNWSSCSVSCGNGTNERNRSCTNPMPKHGGKDCTGNTTEYKPCILPQICPSWGNWGSCDAISTCGQGFRSRRCIGNGTCGGNDQIKCNLTGLDNRCEQLHLADKGKNCSDYCGTRGMACRSNVNIKNATDVINKKGYNCTSWDNATADFPVMRNSFCHGWNNVSKVYCSMNPSPNERRLCRCVQKVDGNFTTWSNWGSCSVECGNGTNVRTRSCTNPKPKNEGKSCIGNTTEHRPCISTQNCPTSILTTTTTPPTTATTTPPTTATTTPPTTTPPTTTTPPPPTTTTPLTTSITTTTPITVTAAAIIHGNWAKWKPWESCSVTCGNGTNTRTRTCTNPAPSNGGAYCAGKDSETGLCALQTCPGIWGEWSTCQASEMCGNGSRERQCLGPGKCNGTRIEECVYESVCKSYSSGGIGNSCDDVCKKKDEICDPYLSTGDSSDIFEQNGMTCSQKKSTEGTLTVSGSSDDILKENYTNQYDPHYSTATHYCNGFMNMPNKINCSATPPGALLRVCRCIPKGDENQIAWSPWTDCSATCEGVRYRNRTCMINTKGPCSLDNAQIQNCSGVCPVHGGFADWSLWSDCSVKCGIGARTRTRSCTNPIPSHGGLGCTGGTQQNEICGLSFCPIHGEWSDWSEWSSGCTKPCEGGEIVRKRYCTNPRPLHGGNYCVGTDREARGCNNHSCENVIVDGVCRFKEEYKPQIHSIEAGREFYKNELQKDLKEAYALEAEVNEDFMKTLESIKVSNLRNGSIIAEFTMGFANLKSYQLVFLQDSLEIDGAIGKRELFLDEMNLLNSSMVPNVGPPNIRVYTNLSSHIKVIWDVLPPENRNGIIRGYLLFYRQYGHYSQPYNVVASNSTYVELQGLNPHTKYSFRLLAYNEKGNGIPSNLFHATTRELPPTEAPANVRGIVQSSSAIYVLWDHFTGHENHDNAIHGYNLYYSSPNTPTARKTIHFPNSTSELRNLISMDVYIIDVCAFNEAGEGPCQRTQARTVMSGDGPETAPTNLHLTYRSHSELSVSWNAIPWSDRDDVTGYKLSLVLITKDSIEMIDETPLEVSLKSSVLHYDFKLLQSNSKYKFSVAGLDAYGEGVAASIEIETCRCSEVIYTNFFKSPPYTKRRLSYETIPGGIFPSVLQDLITLTCGVCDKIISTYNTTVNFDQNGKNQFAIKSTADRVLDDIDEFTSLSFPLSAISDESFAFAGIVRYPGAIFIVRKPSSAEHVKKLIAEIFTVGPILLIDLLMIILSGMIIWALEHYSDARKLTDVNVRDVTEAWYWAYVTQTTIGYGDFVPRTKKARCFAVVWMTVGLVMGSLVTGALTSAFTVTYSRDFKIYGRQMAAVKDSFEARLVQLRNGKLPKTEYSTTDDVLDALYTKQVDGILLDAYAASSYRVQIAEKQLEPVDLLQYPRYQGAVLSGPLANIANTMQDNIKAQESQILEKLEKAKMLPASPVEPMSLFDSDSPTLMEAIEALLIIWVFFIIFGLIFWWCRRGKKEKVVVKPVDPWHDTSLPIKPLWREIIKFRYHFITRTCKLYERIEQERLKLYYDKGSSSLRRENAFKLYKRKQQQPFHTTISILGNAVRKLSRQPENYDHFDNVKEEVPNSSVVSIIEETEVHQFERISDDEEARDGNGSENDEVAEDEVSHAANIPGYSGYIERSYFERPRQ